ncbi:MAG: fimbria major subunit [Bacteroides sp.]|nr:fimbria major subunit [Bacteroides sp.]
MRLTKQFLFGAMATLILGGCSSDTLVQDVSTRPGQSEDNGEGVYMSVNIKMPTSGSSRSYTDGDNSSNSGTEVGKDYENNVNTVYLVLAKKSDNTFISWGEIPANSILKSTDGTVFDATARFSKTDIAAYYNGIAEADTDREVNIFVFCNPTQGVLNALQAADEEQPSTNTWANAIGELDVTGTSPEVIWSQNDFLMTNSAIATRTFPKTIDDWNAYTVSDNPFKLSEMNGEGENAIDNSINNTNGARGPVKVERVAARFDFRDGSPEGTEANTYHVLKAENTTGDDQNDIWYVDVKLNKMSLVNMSKNFYFLRRVSPNGLEEGATLCGAELPWFTDENGTLVENKTGNYVVSPYATEMNSVIKSDFSKYYNYPLFSATGEIDNVTLEAWYTSELSNVIHGETDNWDGSKDNSYHIWRYVTENCIPSVDKQKYGQTTGIVFKGKLIGTDAALDSDDENVKQLAQTLNDKLVDENGKEVKLTGNGDTDPIIYKYTGAKNDVGGMYATWNNVEKAAKASAITPVWEADNTPAGGHWTLEINRSNSLFRAVFGNGSCGSYTFTYEDEQITLDDPIKDPDESAPSYWWHEWDKAGKPSANDPDSEMAELNHKFKKAMTEAGFTLYQSSTDGTDGIGYYCYYYYWNRHNDNGRNGIMGPMEFCVVRNNVYKIAVTNIKSIGHPRITENDPNPPTPDTDDETDDVYLTVQVEVLPWVVRVNDVEF